MCRGDVGHRVSVCTTWAHAKRALALLDQGRTLNSVSKETGVSRAAIRSWRTRVEPRSRADRPCPRCQGAPGRPDRPASYAYLLGFYLGDGCISAHRRGVHYLRIVCDNAWPGLITLEPWQQEIVDAHPWEFIRGLIHSDGCRVTNWTTRLVGGERKRYEYPRYFFTDVSDDTRKLFTDTLDRLGVEWTHCTRHGSPYNISVARRASVALMDAHVGPEH